MKVDAMLVAATIKDVLFMVSVPVGPLVVNVSGEPVTVIVASVIAADWVIARMLALAGR